MTATSLLAPPGTDDDDPLVATAEVIESLVSSELSDEYRIEGSLGWGRWGIRLRARDLRRAEEVVLTALPPAGEEGSAEGDRFLEALCAMAPLDHPHLVPVTAYGVGGALRWYASPAPAGQTLAERIEMTGPLGLPEVRRIAHQLASALDQAHRRGITHGALSPSEVLVDDAGWVHVREIGIASGVAQSPDAMSPEQFERLSAPGQGADQVALAQIIRACLTGGDYEGALPAGLPPSLATALERATRPRPTERYRDLLDFVAALDGASTIPRPLQPSQPRGRRVRRDEWEGLLDPPTPAERGLARLKKARGVVALGVVALVVGSIPLGFRSEAADPPVAWSPPVSAPLPAVALPAPSATTPKAAPVAHVGRTVAPPPKRPRPTPPRSAPPRPTVAELAPIGVSLPGTLYVSARPWGELFIDGTSFGATPQSAVPLAPGRHHVRVTRDGFVPYDGWIEVPSAGTVRMTQIILKELTL